MRILRFVYAIYQLTTHIDPRAGEVGGNVAAVLLTQIVDFCLLGAAALVLIKRGGGGDLHGLTLTAAIFISGSFILLNQLVTIFEYWGAVLVGGALVLAWLKMSAFSMLPGLRLPLHYRLVGMGCMR